LDRSESSPRKGDWIIAPAHIEVYIPPPITPEQILGQYRYGDRDFSRIKADYINLEGADLTGATFMHASLREANFKGARLANVQFKAANLEDACLMGADLTDATLNYSNCDGADMRDANLESSSLESTVLAHARLSRANLSATNLSNINAAPFCNKRIKHTGVSNIDPRTVFRTYQSPGFKAFMLDCGIPEIFAEYMIDCARAINESVWRTMIQTTFISYGGPDEAFAQKLYDALKSHGVVTFFFPKSATMGERIDKEIFGRLQEHDRVILVCSRNSLDRPGVLHEIQETFDRETRDGGATYLLPVTLDDYVFTGWRATNPVLAERVGRRVVGDFRKAARSRAHFDESLGRLLDALKTKRPIY
jgi:hypothetical protein